VHLGAVAELAADGLQPGLNREFVDLDEARAAVAAAGVPA
jgi:hypothetical protein